VDGLWAIVTRKSEGQGLFLSRVLDVDGRFDSLSPSQGLFSIDFHIVDFFCVKLHVFDELVV
jgi:hypothetical protein